jgi:hypothetical protein
MSHRYPLFHCTKNGSVLFCTMFITYLIMPCPYTAHFL